VTAGRKRAAVELVAREDAELRRTARRFSLCEDDAEDAYQRALEILLVKAPSDRPRELVRWTKTVVKHEALAIRRNRERLLGTGAGDTDEHPVERLTSGDAGPDERTERREQVAHSREALSALKPAELRALTLLAAGYSYAEIGEITGFSQTKVNRSLAEGRERFRRFQRRSEDGSRCAELRPLLSRYCDDELGSEGEEAIREHLRACAACRATLRGYRTTPVTVAALAPALPVSRSFFERAHELLLGLHSRLSGADGAGDGGGLAQVAASGGTRGAGMAALAKALAICAGTVGGAAACVATGVAPAPLGIAPDHTAGAKVERVSKRATQEAATTGIDYETAPATPQPSPSPEPAPEPEPEPKPTPGPAETVEAGAVEYVPPEPVAPPPAAESSGASKGGAAGEFGP
jgi:RNA polymerase sigma factor (sigma-70 family)